MNRNYDQIITRANGRAAPVLTEQLNLTDTRGINVILDCVFKIVRQKALEQSC